MFFVTEKSSFIDTEFISLTIYHNRNLMARFGSFLLPIIAKHCQMGLWSHYKFLDFCSLSCNMQTILSLWKISARFGSFLLLFYCRLLLVQKLGILSKIQKFFYGKENFRCFLCFCYISSCKTLKK